jgi:hypothetical protein
MHDRGFWELDDVEDSALEEALANLVGRASQNDARILAHLAEVEERRLHLLAAFPSMYAYCVGRLRLSEDEAYRRIVCARLAWRFPVIFTLVESRGLHMTAVYLLRRHLTEGNHAELLQAACGKTKKEVEEILAVRFPLPDVPSNIRRLPDVPAFSRIEQRSAETFRIQINASKAFKEKLELACDLVSHSVPDRNFAKVLERALDLLIAKVERERFGKLSKPAKKPRHPASGNAGSPSASDSIRYGVGDSTGSSGGASTRSGTGGSGEEAA